MLIIGVPNIFRLRLKLFAVSVAMPYTPMLVLVVNPFLTLAI
jgi:hypothetical protein